MNSGPSSGSGRYADDSPQSGALGRAVRILILVGLLFGGAGYYFFFDRSQSEDIAVGSGKNILAEGRPAKAPVVGDRPSLVTDRYQRAPAPVSAARESIHDDYAKQDYASELLTDLLEIEPVEGGFSVAQINQINHLLRELKQQGAAALPAIQEYLESMSDIDFTAAVNPKMSNYATLRIGLIDVLGQIEGSETKQVLLQTLDVVAAPKEIALLARSLESHAGIEYSPEILAASLDTLDQVLLSEVNETDEDVGFLFAILERYGDGGLADVMEETYPRWKSYSTMVLAKLPNGEGIPALTRLAEQYPETGRDNGYALQMLAQASREHPEAVEALVQIAASGELTNAGWRRIAKTLGGEEYRFRSEMFERTSGHGASLGKPSTSITGLYIQALQGWSDAEIDQRIELIDRLSRIAPGDAVGVLERARNRLLGWRQTVLAAGTRGVR